LRHAKDLTLDDLAEQAGISASHLSRLERGHTLPSFTVLAGIAHVLGVSIDEFAKLEQDVTVLDAELADELARIGFQEDTRNEMLSLSIDGRKELYDRITSLASVPATPESTQEQATRAIMEHGLVGAASTLNRLIGNAGLDSVAFSRALVWLDTTPGQQRVVIASPGALRQPANKIIETIQQSGANPVVSPEVTAWASQEQARRSRKQLIIDRKLLASFAQRGTWTKGSSAADAVSIQDTLQSYVDGIQGGTLEVAMTDSELGSVNYLITETDVLIESPKHSADEVPHFGIVLRGNDAAEAASRGFDALWNQIPARDKDTDAALDWLQGALSGHALSASGTR
jgi:transcriptional regulator with XRE-family HTH domain